MKKFRRFMRSKTGTYILFAAAAVLLLFSSISGARAALIASATYGAQLQLSDIGVALVENGGTEPVSQRVYDEGSDTWIGDGEVGELLSHMLDDEDGDGKDEELKLGKAYPEALSVRNNGSINEYVRVTIYKYWTRTKEDGTVEKDPSLSPDMIDLNLLTGSNGWWEDTASATDERTVLYYTSLLDAGDESAPFSDTITIDGKIADIIKTDPKTSSDGGTVTTYAYDGATFVLEAQVDAVQEHNAEAAIWSAWGRQAETVNDTMRLMPE